MIRAFLPAVRVRHQADTDTDAIADADADAGSGGRHPARTEPGERRFTGGEQAGRREP
ncbi:hypothetical protein [Streptomyces sp. GC420]|uniref:hypothetical protein n=1 Tax=Streptomyces sp. GC420 TaxID=2697568 RepID=UPI001AA1AA6F|nr:hypothetical protein [Streptomyces sp. GC420]NBM17907.1 hypothetical protein [Streptomyces sp. GC420]